MEKRSRNTLIIIIIIIISFLTVTRKVSVMKGTVLESYVFGSCERHSKLTEEMLIPLRPIAKEDLLSS